MSLLPVKWIKELLILILKYPSQKFVLVVLCTAIRSEKQRFSTNERPCPLLLLLHWKKSENGGTVFIYWRILY